MPMRTISTAARGVVLLVGVLPICTPSGTAWAQASPYDVFPAAEPPYHRVRYEASDRPGELRFPVNYTVWIPEGVESLRGVIVHQHGCRASACQCRS